MVVQKKRVVRAYNKIVKKNSFEECKIVWKVVLPLGTKDREFGKWSLNWEGPFKVHQVMGENTYLFSSLARESHIWYINYRYLKKYVHMH